MPATQGIGGSNTLLAWNNYVLTSSLSATSQALPISNIQDERGGPSSAWQTVAGVTQNAVITITPAIQSSTWRVWGLFRTNLTPFAQMTVTLYNTPNLFVWNASVEGPEPGFGQTILIANTDMTADYCTIEIDDPGNPDNFLNIPLVYAGPAWKPLTGLAYDTTFGGDFGRDQTTSRGGQEYLKLLWERRRAELSFMGIREGEILGQLAELQFTARRGNNILAVRDITSETIAQEAIYGLVTATSDEGFPYAAADRRSWRAKITERL